MEIVILANVQGVCKDCGNGTLNNDLVPAFEVDDPCECVPAYCLRCGSEHLDIVPVGL